MKLAEYIKSGIGTGVMFGAVCLISGLTTIVAYRQGFYDGAVFSIKAIEEDIPEN